MAFPITLFLPLKPYSYVFFIMTILFPFFERDRDWWCLILLSTLLDNNEFSIFLILWMWTMYELPKGYSQK